MTLKQISQILKVASVFIIFLTDSRHCIIATGITCTTCDSDAEESVPLQKEAEEAATSAVASAVGTDTQPLDFSSEDSTSDSGGFFQSGFYQQSGSSGQPLSNSYQDPYYQGGGYSGANRGYSGYSAYSSGYTGLSSNLYNSGGFGVRSFRRARGAGRRRGLKPMLVTVGKGVKSTEPLLKFLPAIKGVEKQVEYIISSGNQTMFEISQKGRLGFLHSRMPLSEGTYALKIESKLKKEDKVDGEAKSWFHKKSFALRLIVKVI